MMSDDNSGVGDFLEDESFAESSTNVLVFPSEPTLRHSATTDTLDSVILETSPADEEILDDINNTQADKSDSKKDTSLTLVEFTQSDNDVTPQGADSSLLGTSPSMDFSKVEENQDNRKRNVEEDKFNQSPLHISSYFKTETAVVVESDPFGQNFFDNISNTPQEDKSKAVSPDGVFGDVEDLGNVGEVSPSAVSPVVDVSAASRPDPIESRLSHEEPESVDFQVVPEDTETNVMEASLQVIDDKEDFESFTAEGTGDGDQDILSGLSMSPSNKLMSERMSQLHITDTIPIDTVPDSGPVSYDRQLSNKYPDLGLSPAHQPFQGTPLPPMQLSAFPTPVHQSHQSVTPLAEPTSDSYLEVQIEDKLSETAGSPPKSGGLASAFQILGDGNAADPFSTSIHMSEADRQHDAWLPSDATRHILVTVTTSPGSFVPTEEQISTPSIVVNESQGDPVRDLVHRYMGEQEAIKRQILTVDSVTQNVDGLKKLLEGGCYRSAVELTGRLLTAAGQGSDNQGDTTPPTQHTSHTLQLWFCRLSLLMKLKLYNIVESELQGFQNLDTPDLYYEFYPQIYPGRKGTIVSFGMRLLHAELPHYLGRSQEALDRLHYILAVTQKIIKNLDEGLCEDGSAVEISEESRKVSRELWYSREKKVLFIIGNTFLAIKDYEASMTVYEALLVKDPQSKPSLLSGLGLIYLQMGNVSKATDCFKQAEVLTDITDKKQTCRTYLNKGLESMCTNSFSDAYQNFKTAVEHDPTNASAVNNMAVCSLYLGKLRDALKTLEVLVHEDPIRNLHEGILFNLCTLYELESSRALHKKQALLDLVSRYKGDGFPVACLKMA
ncbi:trafficking protein particle complex subunit 12-like [Mizuhopecten yessoensis]|uniref:Trafficking protein particle complex subunit 12 n=2 Tax=Pectinidae TaxID=6566 RepID=A0A210QAJ3_MIZYE|nr:trafficking protein particle complex subunit 12-like [Mizuhopecten yessoensis]OWF45748.1 Trafficking protein particle complex subunit 12 [Mizuhopecten yessoensis]